MRYLLLLSIFAINAVPAFSQVEVKEKIFSSNLQDTVYYNVFLPVNSQTESGMPTLYAIKYGMIEGSYIAAQLRYFQDANYPIPKTIVVTIQADMDRTGFSYKTGLLTNTGSKFMACLKDEIIPAVEKKYHTSSFRTYLGHSYSASYASYMMQHNPELFRGYILLATEEVGFDPSLPASSPSRQKTQSSFHLNKDDVNFYNNTTTLCYAATGIYDENRRKNYVQELLSHFSSIDSGHFISKYDSIPRGDHTNILTTAIQPALEFIYQLYDPLYESEQESVRNTWDLFLKAKERIMDVYGISSVKNFNWYRQLLQQAAMDKDTNSLTKIYSCLDTGNLKAFQVLRVATLYANTGSTDRAKQYYQQTIGSILARHIGELNDVPTLDAAYQGMALNVYKNNPDLAWGYLQKSIDLVSIPDQFGASNIDTYFTVGDFAVSNNYKVETGLQYLLKYLKLRVDVNDALHFPYYRIYYKIAEGYYHLNKQDKAREFIKKSLSVRNDFQPAKDLMDKLK